MENYKERIIELALSTNSATDYGDKAKLRRHNAAMKKLYAISLELKEDKQKAAQVYTELLTHPEEKVRYTAAAELIQLDICTKEAYSVMRKIWCEGEDLLISLHAKMYCEGWFQS